MIATDFSIVGKLHHVVDYSGYSEEPVDQQGNFIALRFKSDAYPMQVNLVWLWDPFDFETGVVGGMKGSTSVTENDCVRVFHITDKDNQKILVNDKLYDLSNLFIETI